MRIWFHLQLEVEQPQDAVLFQELDLALHENDGIFTNEERQALGLLNHPFGYEHYIEAVHALARAIQAYTPAQCVEHREKRERLIAFKTRLMQRCEVIWQAYEQCIGAFEQ